MPKGDATYPTMTIDECLAFADEWSRGMTYHAGSQGWRVVCMLLAEEVRAMRADTQEVAAARGFLRERDGLLRQLAAAQAREAKLREVLTAVVLRMRETPAVQGDEFAELGAQARAAMNLRSDDTPLREMIEAAKAEERESIIAAMPGGCSVDPQWVCDMIRARRG